MAYMQEELPLFPIDTLGMHAVTQHGIPHTGPCTQMDGICLLIDFCRSCTEHIHVTNYEVQSRFEGCTN